MEKICWQITVAAFMQPLQDDLWSRAAKDNNCNDECSHSTMQPWRSHYNAICRDGVAKHNRTTRNGVGNCGSKTGSRHQSEKKTILKHFLKGFLEGKSLAPKWRKSADKSLWQPSCSHSNTISEVQLQKTIVLRMPATAGSNLDAAIAMRSAETELQNTNRTTRNGVGNCSSKTGSRRQSRKSWFLKRFLIKNWNRKWKQAKSERIQLQQVHPAITMRLATIPSKTQWYYVLSSSTEACETF